MKTHLVHSILGAIGASGEKPDGPIWKNRFFLGGGAVALIGLATWIALQWIRTATTESDISTSAWPQTLFLVLFLAGGSTAIAAALRRLFRSGDSTPKAVREPSLAGPIDAAHVSEHPPLWNNVVTMLGLFLIAIAVILLLTFGLFHLATPSSNPYVDIVGYLVLPSILVFGIFVMALGVLVKRWRLKRRDPELVLAFGLPRIDLNDPRQRRTAKIFLGGSFLMLPVVGVSSYHGYHYTDSAEFCSLACHSVMEPQATAYEHSPHARVSCAECHIGEGASWFVKSKLSGTRQVFATWQNSYPRPIPPAIADLRPARETCEHCHWPKKFFGAQLREIVHFASDEKNTRTEIGMLLKTGGGDESIGRAEGIHLHMALSGRIEYVATDEGLQVIPWVKYTDEAGNEWVYRSDGGGPKSDPRPQGVVRQLDCMDCHNRPAHKFRSPQQAVNLLLDVGRIDTTLPFIKREAVALLSTGYPDTKTAEAQIGLSLTKFYKNNYPDLWEKRRAAIFQAIDTVRDIYRNNFFPDMNVDWKTYPDNIGHKTSPGCFRCHDGKHIDQRGKPISHQCKVCHSFLNPLNLNGRSAAIEKGEFIHPFELQGPHQTLRCDRCHTGGVAPAKTCDGCHTAQHGFYAASDAAWSRYDLQPSPMFGIVDCEGCHDPSQPLSIQSIDATCIDCHEDEEEKYEGMLVSWMDGLAKARDIAAESIDAVARRAEAPSPGVPPEDLQAWIHQSREAMESLAEAGPHHNPDAALEIYRRIIQQAAERTTSRPVH